MCIILIIGIATSFKLNMFLHRKYSEYELTDNMIKISILLSLVFSIIIWLKIVRNTLLYNGSIYLVPIYIISSGVMSGVLSSSFIIDLFFKELPDENNALIGVSILILSITQLGYKTILSSVIMFAVFFILSVITGQFGMGDVKMLFFMGFGIPIYRILNFIFMAFFLASCYLLVMFLFRRYKRKDTISFGPFLIMSFLLTIL